MNLTTLLRDHPDLAEMIGESPEHLVSCHGCPARVPPDQLYNTADGPLCARCFDQDLTRRRDEGWAEWWDRAAKEAREGAA